MFDTLRLIVIFVLQNARVAVCGVVEMWRFILREYSLHCVRCVLFLILRVSQVHVVFVLVDDVDVDVPSSFSILLIYQYQRKYNQQANSKSGNCPHKGY